MRRSVALPAVLEVRVRPLCDAWAPPPVWPRHRRPVALSSLSPSPSYCSRALALHLCAFRIGFSAHLVKPIVEGARLRLGVDAPWRAAPRPRGRVREQPQTRSRPRNEDAGGEQERDAATSSARRSPAAPAPQSSRRAGYPLRHARVAALHPCSSSMRGGDGERRTHTLLAANSYTHASVFGRNARRAHHAA